MSLDETCWDTKRCRRFFNDAIDDDDDVDDVKDVDDTKMQRKRKLHFYEFCSNKIFLCSSTFLKILTCSRQCHFFSQEY